MDLKVMFRKPKEETHDATNKCKVLKKTDKDSNNFY